MLVLSSSTLEVLEIMLSTAFLAPTASFLNPLGSLYGLLIGGFEVLALLVLTACVVLSWQGVTYMHRLKRFTGVEMTEWPRSLMPTYILIIEICLMTAFLTMNAADHKLQLVKLRPLHKSRQFPGEPVL